eukprot:403334963
MKKLKDEASGIIKKNQLDQPLYTFAKDAEPIDFNRKIYVRLFKKSRQTQQMFDKEIKGNNSKDDQQQENKPQSDTITERKNPFKSSRQKQAQGEENNRQKQNSSQVIDELIYLDRGDGQIDYIPRNPANALKYMNIALNEIDYLSQQEQSMDGKCSPHKKLSMLQKNRLALKFVEMNSSPEKYKYFDRFTEENIKSVRMNLKEQDLKRFAKLREKEEERKQQKINLRIQRRQSKLDREQQSPPQLMSPLSLDTVDATDSLRDDKQAFKQKNFNTHNNSMNISLFDQFKNIDLQSPANPSQRKLSIKENIENQLSQWKTKKFSRVDLSTLQINNQQMESVFEISAPDLRINQSFDSTQSGQFVGQSYNKNKPQMLSHFNNIIVPPQIPSVRNKFLSSSHINDQIKILVPESNKIRGRPQPILTDRSAQYLPLISQQRYVSMNEEQNSNISTNRDIGNQEQNSPGKRNLHYRNNKSKNNQTIDHSNDTNRYSKLNLNGLRQRGLDNQTTSPAYILMSNQSISPTNMQYSNQSPSVIQNSTLTQATQVISDRNQKTLDTIKDPILKLRRSFERFGKDVDELLSHSHNTDYIMSQRQSINNSNKLSYEDKMAKYEEKFNEAMTRFDQIHEDKAIQKTSIKEYSEKIRSLMIKKRIRKYGNIGQL